MATYKETERYTVSYQPTTEGNVKQIRQAAKALASARRPVLYVGGGVVLADASEELTEFATSDRFPVTLTLNDASVAGTYRLRQASLIASRCLVNANVVPLLSWRTTVVMVRSGSVSPGLVRAILGSFQFVIWPM